MWVFLGVTLSKNLQVVCSARSIRDSPKDPSLTMDYLLVTRGDMDVLVITPWQNGTPYNFSLPDEDPHRRSRKFGLSDLRERPYLDKYADTTTEISLDIFLNVS